MKKPLAKTELAELAKKLVLRPKEFVRTKEKDFKDNHLNEILEDDNALINAMTHFPKIIERPIVVKGKKAVLSRPPEKVMGLM